MDHARTDLMYTDEIREAVGATYRSLPHGAGRAVAERLYDADQLASLPDTAIDWALGVGNPVRDARLQPGEVVLDLGCGGGIDSILAAHQVGPDGRVIGLDLLPAMCDRARHAAEEAGVAERCQFLPGQMEAIPLPAAAVDVVISNGVLNLSPRKSRALAETARVLKADGRLCVADLVVDTELPPQVLGSPAVWAGCIAGAMSEDVLRRKLDRVGMTDVRIDRRTPFGVDQIGAYPLFTPDVIDLLRQELPPADLRQIATAVVVQAVMPIRGTPTTPDPGDLGWVTGVTHLLQLPVDDVKAPGVTVRQLKRVEDTELKILEVEPHGSTPFHTHPHAHEGVVIAGTGRLRLAGRHEPLRPGSVFTVNPTDQHAIESAGDDPLRVVCMDCFVR